MLKSFIFLLSFLILLISCQESAEEKKEKSMALLRSKSLGLAYLEENKLEEAEENFIKVIDLAPKEKLGYANLSIVYLRTG